MEVIVLPYGAKWPCNSCLSLWISCTGALSFCVNCMNALETQQMDWLQEIGTTSQGQPVSAAGTCYSSSSHTKHPEMEWLSNACSKFPSHRKHDKQDNKTQCFLFRIENLGRKCHPLWINHGSVEKHNEFSKVNTEKI